MCALLRVSRSEFYAHQARVGTGPGPRQRRRADLAAQIMAAHEASGGVYGAPRVHAELRAGGVTVSRKTVAKIMCANDIRGISLRPWRPVTTITSTRPHTIPDLVGRRFDTGKLDAVWTSDITYLSTGQGWLYLCAVRDGCSRRVIGYAFSPTLHTDLVEQAMRRAVRFRGRPVHATVFHADKGCQYTSTQLAQAAEDLGLRLSVGRTGVCWDNAQQESFWSTLKTEFYHRHTFTTRSEAVTAVTGWIETVYNRTRRHSALAYLSPVQFENTKQTATQAA